MFHAFCQFKTRKDLSGNPVALIFTDKKEFLMGSLFINL